MYNRYIPNGAAYTRIPVEDWEEPRHSTSSDGAAHSQSQGGGGQRPGGRPAGEGGGFSLSGFLSGEGGFSQLLKALKLENLDSGDILLLRIVLPMSSPILATLTLMIGLGYWNDWMNGLYYINSDSLYSVQVLLNKMLMNIQFLLSGVAQSSGIELSNLPATGIRMAIAVLGVLPLLVVYPFFQRYFVRGILIGAIKG